MSLTYLLDANLSPRVARDMAAAGLSVQHVSDVGLVHASDEEIFDFAAGRNDVVVTADSDFAMILALRRATTPSVVLLRHVADLRPPDHAALLTANLSAVADDLAGGAIVSLSLVRLSVRRLPIA